MNGFQKPLKYKILKGFIFFSLSFLLACQSQQTTQESIISKSDLKQIVSFLASDKLQGRYIRTDGNKKAQQFIIEYFRSSGLKPGGVDGSYLQEFKLGTNVIGLLEGEVKNEYIIISVHHDHLGVVNGKIYNGADDNASGVAVLLTLAKAFCQNKNKPRRSILFISFDAEEERMLGSAYFLRSKLYNLKNFVAMICLDLVGGNMFEWDENRVYALGSEHSNLFQEKLKNNIQSQELDVSKIGIYLIEPFGPISARSDYTGFRNLKIPFIFFSVGIPWYYHTEFDDPENLNYDKMEKFSQFLYGLILDIANGERHPDFISNPEPSVDDAKYILDILEMIFEHPYWWNLSEEDERYVENTIPELQKMTELCKIDKHLLQKTVYKVFSIVAKSGRK